MIRAKWTYMDYGSASKSQLGTLETIQSQALIMYCGDYPPALQMPIHLKRQFT